MSPKHMKSLIVLVVGLLAVGCATLTPEEKAVGEYEYIDDNGNAHKYVLQESGVAEFYWSDRKSHIKRKWKISKDRELHIDDKLGAIPILTINPDGSITLIADIVDGKRTDYPKEDQTTVKKIK